MQQEGGLSTTLQEFTIDPPVSTTSVEIYVLSVYGTFQNGFAEIEAYGNILILVGEF